MSASDRPSRRVSARSTGQRSTGNQVPGTNSVSNGEARPPPAEGRNSPDGGTVSVTVKAADGPDGKSALLVVRDEGVGIPQNDLPHIFDRFRRGANVVGRFAGTGLGLASARDLVELHGGTICVKSEEGKGSTFVVRLPLTPPAEASLSRA
jgi:signal transduction histidine kinase